MNRVKLTASIKVICASFIEFSDTFYGKNTAVPPTPCTLKEGKYFRDKYGLQY